MIDHIEKQELPANFRDQRDNIPSLWRVNNIEQFMENDLFAERLDDIVDQLWTVGRPYVPRALNVQLVLDRKIVATNEASLHLVWTSKKIFLKALPAYILSTSFYDAYLSRSSRLPKWPKYGNPSGEVKCRAHALGLLYTYVALVPSELDFEIALQHYLLPKSCKWNTWRDLSIRVLEDYPDQNIYDHLPIRFKYGELRLSRLDKIWRFGQGDWLHGYSKLTGTTRYVEFLSDNLHSFAAAGAYIVIVLSGMQVALQTNIVAGDNAYQRVCYGFAMFSMIAPALVVGTILLVFWVMFCVNWWRTHKARQERSTASKPSQP